MDNKLIRDKKVRRNIRKFRARKKIVGTNQRPRLVLVKTLKYLYVQLINDLDGVTIAGCSTLNEELKKKFKNAKNQEAAIALGKIAGKMIKDKGFERIVFDRNGCLYHGKIKAFADAVREAGIDF